LKRVLDRKESKLGLIVYESVERSSRLLVFAIGIYITLALFEFGEGAEGIAQLVARAILLVAAFVAIYSIVDIIFANVSTIQNVLGIHLEERLVPFLRVVIQVTVVIIGALIILQEFGVNITALLASFGVVGLALSLAAQDTAANVFSFAAIVSDNPFKVGDYITAKEYAGTVEHVGVRSTRIRRLDQTLVIVPNNLVTSAAVVNASRLIKRRLDFFVRFEYDTTSAQIRAATEAIREMLKMRPYTEADSVLVHFVTFSDNSLDVRIICNIMLADWNAFTAEQEEINLQVLDIIQTLGIKMGRQSLFIENLPEYDELPPQVAKSLDALKEKTTELKAVQVKSATQPLPVVPSPVPDQTNQSASNESSGIR
jgi:MscS family membrane protein